MKKKLATTIATAAIASGLLAFSSVSSAATASPTYDFTNLAVYGSLNGTSLGSANGLVFYAGPSGDTISTNANPGQDPKTTLAPCSTLAYACGGDGLGIVGAGTDADEIGNDMTSGIEVLQISGFNGIDINEITFLDLFYEKETSNTNFFNEKAFFTVNGSQTFSLEASESTGTNGFAVWTGLLTNVATIDFYVVCSEVTSAKCSDNDYSVAAINAVPVPAAVWLFGSGLIGLVGIARRRKAA